jgi:hypothetical protein
VYLWPDIDHEYATRALEYLEANAGISYVLVTANANPRVTVRSGQLGGSAGATGGINLVDGNNRSRTGTVTIATHNVPCRWNDDSCMNMYRHELLGILGHLDYPVQPPSVPSGFGYPGRELALLRTLYSLPHGTKVNPDGTGPVVLK